MRLPLGCVLLSTACSLLSFAQQEPLFRDLALAASINQEIAPRALTAYNSILMTGYLNMPSARMAPSGTMACGASWLPPYLVYGANVQLFSRVELSVNYRIYRGILDPAFGRYGFGDLAERIPNIKIALLTPQDGYEWLPYLAAGTDDVVGSRRFRSHYMVATKIWPKQQLELSLGLGRGRYGGVFGGASWIPLHAYTFPLVKNLQLFAEYDAINYAHYPFEHPKGRMVSSRINGGVRWLVADTLQFSMGTLRGREVAASCSLRYPLGHPSGPMPKSDDPAPYDSSGDLEPLGQARPERTFAHQLAHALAEQGFELLSTSLSCDADGREAVWLRIANSRYREERAVRTRLEPLFASLMPSNLSVLYATIEVDALALHTYRYRREDLERFRTAAIGAFELSALSPSQEALTHPDEAQPLLRQRKDLVHLTLLPRLLTHFGSTRGKVKCDFGAVGSAEGHLPYDVYYRMQLSYSLCSNFGDVGIQDYLNPSPLLQVRTDTARYHMAHTAALEQAYIQKSWNLGSGWFYRVASGHFEPAFGGVATECLWHPLRSLWAFGAEAAFLLKRQERGVVFTSKVPRRGNPVPYHGLQAFFHLCYHIEPLAADLKAKIGQFLAKDKGVRFELTKHFPTGVRFSLWTTLTNAHDIVSGTTYFDKGFALEIPLDFCLTKSKRGTARYSLAAWLRDSGAIADTGKTLQQIAWDPQAH